MSDFDNIAAASVLGAIATDKETRPAGFHVSCAIAGVVVAAGLELLSPTGSKTSAIVAGVVGGAVVYASKDYLDAVPQNDLMGAISFGATALISMKAGRITADYFPGNVE